MSGGLVRFLEARQFLLDHRQDYEAAYAGFRWPEPGEFNWALEWFDHLGAAPDTASREALRIIEPGGSQRAWTFAELSARSAQVAS